VKSELESARATHSRPYLGIGLGLWGILLWMWQFDDRWRPAVCFDWADRC